VTTRRAFLRVVAASALAGCGQTSAPWRIGFLEAGSESANRHFVDAFRKGMHDLGYDDGRNIVIDIRWAEGRAERFPAMLGELSKGKPDVIVVASSLGAVATRKLVHDTPVVFVGVSDPVALGLVADLARPGGNMTGLSRVFGAGLLGKALEALREIVPSATRIAILYNPEGAVEPRVLEAESAMRTLALTPIRVPMRDERSLEGGFQAMRAERADAMLVVTDPLTLRHRDVIVQGAARNRVPAVYEFAEFARAGGLVSYSASIPALFERAAVYVDKILKGARAGDLPVEQPTKFELVVNERAARDLGLTVPQSLLMRADETQR
jgi:putative ABC transport system substrate-binding protein